MDAVSIVLNVLTLGIALYLATPIYCIVWLAQQRPRQMPLKPGFRCLLIWLASAVFLLLIFFSGVWYTEHATVMANIFVVLFETAIFIAMPVLLIRYLLRHRNVH
jgi:hypothetical protein